MNILIIGNGFDLAHHLPTKYTDFLKFIKVLKKIKEEFVEHGEMAQDDIEWYDIDEKLHSIIIENLDREDRLSELIKDNIWIEYFLQCDMHGDENWIDFESEISEVIQSIDRDMRSDEDVESLYDEVNYLSNDYIYGKLAWHKEITYKKLIEKLLNDLDNLISSLEIYLAEYVEKIKVDDLLYDIKQLAPDIDKVVSFNYTYI